MTENPVPPDPQNDPTPRPSRRALLTHLAVAGAGAAAGAAGAVLAAGRPAAALDNSPVMAAATNTATAPTLLTYTGTALGATGASVLSGAEAAPGPNPTDGVNLFPAAVGGYAVDRVANGVHGSTRSAAGYGVVAANAAVPSASQPAPVALALAALGAHIRFLPPAALAGLGAADQIGPPDAVHHPGELLVDDAFNLWFSVPVTAGQLGWVKLAGRDTAGSFHPLPVPLRVYDSRTGSGPAASGEGPMGGGGQRTLDITVGFIGDSTDLIDAVPASATAAAMNVTVVDTTGSGFLAVYAAGLAYPGTSNVNWSGPGQITANFAVCATSVNGSIALHAGGNGSANVVVDVTGFYR